MKKILAVGIIFLFIGVVVAPSINHSVVKASTDDGLVEVTTQACGIKGYGNTTVKLTREQYQNLEQYLVEVRARLNQTTTREEAVPIFKEAVVELDKYGLLPKGMSVERAQTLVTGYNQNRNERLLNNRQRQEFVPLFTNVFCLLSMTATVDPNSSIPLILSGGPLYLIGLLLGLFLDKIGALNLEMVLFILLILFGILNPFKLMNIVFILDHNTDFHSFGLNGVVESNDVFILLGYTGLLLNPLGEKVYFLGSALAVI